jgi:DNA recombination protein RmuC
MNFLEPAMLELIAAFFALAFTGALFMWQRERGAGLGLKAELAAANERVIAQEDARATMSELLRAQALESAHTVADELVKRADQSFKSREDLTQARLEAQLKPVAETLAKFEQQVQAIEKARAEETGGLKQQITSLLDASVATQNEARKLSDALKRAPNVRGRWGEQSLRNVLEACSLNGRFDFVEQATVESDEGRALRPDALVRLAGGGVLALDSKVNLNPYLDALGAQSEEERAEHVSRYVKGFKAHVDALSRKAYWDQFRKPPFERSPGFVVMYVPGENFLCAALDAHPSILDDARQAKVLIASPTSLFALLQTVALGWRAEDQAQNAQTIAELGRELYARISTMTDHIEDVGHHLQKAVVKYNAFIGSLKDRVLPQARKFEKLGADHQSKEIPDIQSIDIMPRELAPPGATPSLPSPNPA